MFKVLRILGTIILLSTVLPTYSQTNSRGSTTGPTGAKGYDHPNQYLGMQATTIADNMEPVMVHLEQNREALKKLNKAEEKYGCKPNILIFLMDDVGWMDPGFNGGGVSVGNPTPNIDRLAFNGKILTSAYSTPSCTPTRATIMTGQTPLHHGLLRPPMYGEPGGLDSVITLPALLQEMGYITQGVGKWHIGENEASQPQNVGFDDYYGFLGVSDMYTEWRDVYFNPEVALSPSRFSDLEQLPFNHHNVHCTGEKGVESVYVIDLESIKNLDQDWADYSENFIRRQKNNKQPWFLYHCSRACHFDNYPNDKYAGKSPARTAYSDAMVEIDEIFGRLVRALEETGQLDNTIIFFTSDNGPEAEIPPHGRTPFRGAKGSSWEGGVRVPTFVYWRGMITPGRSDGLFDLADIFNTCLSLAGMDSESLSKQVGSTRYVDGIDQASFLIADDGQSNRYSRIYTMNEFFSAVRIDEFKFHLALEVEDAFFHRGYTGGFSGAIINNLGGPVMTNLYTNPQEDISDGMRHIPVAVYLEAEVGRYYDVLKKFPEQTKIGFKGK